MNTYTKPLAFLLRPKTIKDIIGQEHIINNQSGLISRMVKNGYASSLIFYGAPGIGKTSIALALANDLKIKYSVFNAEIDKKSDLEKIINLAKKEPRFIIIVEEIHRMNKDRQDILLKYLENGDLIMFACTTENPFFLINPSVRSRANIIKLNYITETEMAKGLQRIIDNSEYELKLQITEKAIKQIALISAGDLRIAINILELCINLYPNEKIDQEIIQLIAPTANLRNFSSSDEHHDLKSALQKSIRGSDVDAALYYFARLLASGDYESLMRRMIIIAYEDIGLANPTLPVRVKTAIEVFRQVGLPEGRIPLGLAIVEMCLSEKSNSAYLATNMAYDDILSGKIYPIPDHLRDTHYKSANQLGSGIGYNYSHYYENSYIKQEYMPQKMMNVKYYNPKLHSVYEKRINDLFNNFKKGKK
jgi:putative ATPase